MATQLPIYQPYGTVQSSYQQMMGTGPIQYNVPLSQLRQTSVTPNLNPQGSLSPEQRIDRNATRLAEKGVANLRATGKALELLDPYRAQGLMNYELTPYEKANYQKLQQAGYSQDYSLANAGSGAGAAYRPNSIEGQFLQGSFDRDIRDRNAGWALTGYQQSSQVQRAYQQLLNRI